MKLLTVIPSSLNKDLISAYKDVISKADEWILILDHDAMFTTYEWHRQLEMIAKRHPECKAFVSVTNRIGGKRQLHNEYKGDDIKMHREIGYRLMMEHTTDCEDYTKPTPHHFSGVCMLLHKSIFDTIDIDSMNGSKILGIDSKLHDNLYKNGFKTMIMKGVYVFHWYRGGGNDKKHLA